MKKIMLFCLFALAACATVKPVYVRDGIQVYRATCNGFVRDISDCYALASEQCAGRFEVVNTIENETDNFFSEPSVPEVKQTTYMGNTKYTTTTQNNPFMIGGNKLIQRSLFFYCK